jgi:Ca-activated chloride channel family protein
MKIETFLDYQTILANQPRPVHFALKLTADEIVQPRSRPAAFCLVLDRSGSMAGKPLELARQAAQLVIKNLRPEDHFALVTFETDARTLIPLQPARDKERLAAIARTITDAGRTNLTAGWMLGRDELAKAPADASRRLLLLSDGQLNHGIVEPALVQQVVTGGLEHQQIRTSCVGFGDHYNEELLAQLARVTSGQFYHVGSPEQLPGIFDAELDGLQKITAQNVRVRVAAGEFCEAFAQLGDYPSVPLPDGQVEFSLGDLTSGEERILCFAVEALALPCINGQPVASLAGEELVKLEILFDEISASGIAPQRIQQVIRIQATQDPATVQPNGEVISWVSMQKAAHTMREANRALDEGRHADASSLLRDCVQQLKAYGPAEAVAEAVKSLDDVERRIQEGWSIRSRKVSHYRAASYLKMSSAELWSLEEAAPSFKRHPKAPKGPPANQPGPESNPPAS